MPRICLLCAIEGAILASMDRDEVVGRVFESADSLRPDEQKSDLNVWLWEHAEAFAAHLAKQRRVSWSRLARALFEEAGISKFGNEAEPIMGETLRSAWYRTRVRKSERGDPEWVQFSASPRAKRGQPARQQKPPREPSDEIAPGVRASPVEAPVPTLAPTEPAAMPDDLIAQLSVGQRHLTKRGV
jgi:hypothetical protein